MGVDFKAVLVIGYVREVDDFLSWQKAECEKQYGGEAESFVEGYLRRFDPPVVVERLGNCLSGEDLVLAVYFKDQGKLEPGQSQSDWDAPLPGAVPVTKLVTPKMLGDLERLGQVLRENGFAPGPLVVHAVTHIY